MTPHEHDHHEHDPAGHDRHGPAAFDASAATWDDDPAKVARAGDVAAAIRRAITVDTTTRLFEYGAGTGLLTQALGSAVGSVTLADTSAGMRAVMEVKVASGALPASAKVIGLDLSTEAAPDDRFDLAVTVLTLHHLTDVPAALARFRELLDVGGHLCIADLDHEDGSFHGEGFGGHHGFERAALAEDLAKAGFTDIDIDDCGHVSRHDGEFSMFLAVAKRQD